jgi:hypothetical protein
MAWALFKGGEKLSRTFSTQEETLEKAGLVEHSDGQPALEDELKIKRCLVDHRAAGRRGSRLDAGRAGVVIML